MMNKNKRKYILASIIILLPMAVGLLLWDRLPEQVPTHWGFDGTANGWSSRVMAVFGMPLLFLGLFWVVMAANERAVYNQRQNRKMTDLIVWLIPVLSVFGGLMTYAAALGRDNRVQIFAPALVGFVLVMVGNYLPKCKQNRTVGIKIKWTLEDEANWNATHRLAGKLWVAGGLVMMVCALLWEQSLLWAFPVLLVIIAGIPVLFSYCYYKKNGR